MQRISILALASLIGAAAVAVARAPGESTAATAAELPGSRSAQVVDEHDHHGTNESAPSTPISQQHQQRMSAIPASGAQAAARVQASPNRAEWQVIRVSPTDSVIAWVAYPARIGPAPVVIVIHENAGLNVWTRGVADQLATDGFIAIAPDLITMKRTGDLTAEWPAQEGRAAISSLTDAEVRSSLDAVAAFGLGLPNAGPKYGIVGFCWGGARSFQHAMGSPALGASVVYYGSTPPLTQLASVNAPVLGLYGGNDARITATVPATDSAMKSHGKMFMSHVFPGAGHGFLRAQEPDSGPNLAASRLSWPLTLAWFRTHLAG